MDIKDLTGDTYVDLFGDASGNIKSPTFSASEQSFDVLSTTETTTIASTTETTTASSTTETTTLVPDANAQDADILSNKDAKPGRKPKYDFSDLSGYYQDRVKTGKFVKVVDGEDEEGNETLFVPKTPEEFDEVIEIQVNHKLEQEKKQLEEAFYNSKSPAWKTVMKFAEMVDDPSQMIPFLQGVRTIQSIQNVDENELDGAEKIVRTRLEQKGEDDDVIESQIEALKTTGKLVDTAKKLKPLIVKQETETLQEQVRQEKERELRYYQIVSEIRENAVKAIDSPIFGKVKLKQEEKAAIYDLIGEPSQQHQGYGIYPAIDALFDKRDFETLKEVALLLQKKEAFMNYLSASAAEKTKLSLEKKLRASTEKSNQMDHDVEDNQVIVKRDQFNRTPRFGK